MATNTRRAPKSQDVAEQNLGENVTIEVNDGVLTVTIDLSHRGERSTSGKTVRVASTNGNQRVPGSTVTLGLNAYVKP